MGHEWSRRHVANAMQAYYGLKYAVLATVVELEGLMRAQRRARAPYSYDRKPAAGGASARGTPPAHSLFAEDSRHSMSNPR